MSELKPCPFCGGRQTYRKHDGGVWLTTTNHKRGCIMRDALAFVAFNTEAEAIAAWNTRADDYQQAAEYWQRMYEEAFAERTCYDANASAREHGAHCFLWRCSNCNESYDTEMDSMNYCPNCGAKVVKE